MRTIWMSVLVLLAGASAAPATDVVTTPFPGVGITRIERTLASPRPLVINILVVDLTDPQIEFLVTPEDPTFRMDYTLARTTTYVTQWGLDGAINANFWTGGLGSEGDSRDVIGPAVSDGSVVHTPRTQAPYDPALAIRPDGTAFCAYLTTLTTERECVSGIGYDSGLTGTMLVENGLNRGTTARPAPGTADPRTVAGVTADGQTLILAAIDGRTTASQGMTLPEAADLLLEFNAWNGVNLDGGGSTTMVLREPGQGPQIINLTTGSERAVANHLGFRVVPDHDEAVLVAAFAFGATDHTQAVYNAPSVSYVKLRQESGSTASIEYDAGRGYGYTDLTGLNPVPNDNSAAFNGDQIYAENIGVKGSLGTITFRVDVPNGVYRFVAAGGDAGEYNHVTKVRVRNGGTGLWINLVDHEHVFRPTIWRVGFADKIPPPADGGGHDSGTYTDPTFRALFNSGVVSVTGGYLEFQQIGKGVNSADLWGGDLCLLELWRLILPSPDIHVSPLEVVFPGTASGQLSDPFEIVVTNNGTGLLTYAAGVVGPDASEFEIVAGAAGSVSPTEQALVLVRFVPTRTGPASAALEISSDDPDEPVVSVPLSGYGLSDPPPDLDEDGDVDLEDYVLFADCLGGPFVPGPADSDGDGDADLDDFAFWLPCMGGPGIAIDESCSVMDLDMDEDVDLADFSRLTEGFTGALEGPLPPGCRASDFDSDRDVDLLDFAEMQAWSAR